MIRRDFCTWSPAGLNRRLDLCDRRGAHGLPRREALAQPQEGDVAVAVVRRLRETRQDELGERVDYLEAMRRQAEAFVAAIDGGPKLLTTIRDAAHTLRLCLKLLDA